MRPGVTGTTTGPSPPLHFGFYSVALGSLSGSPEGSAAPPRSPMSAPLPASPSSPLRLDALRLLGAAPKRGSAPWATGIPPLDTALGGGIPRGRLTELAGPPAVGKTALLHPVVARVLAGGGWVAWVDAGRTLAPAPWAPLGARFVVVRLPDPRRAAWTAELLLRSGVFGLVVLDGAPALGRVPAVRLAQLARDRDAACVLLAHHLPGEPRVHRLAGAVQLRLALRAGLRGARLVVTVEKGGALGRHQVIEVDRVIGMARRMCTDSAVPDRRGVATRAGRPWAPRTGAIDGSDADRLPDTPVALTWGGLGVASADLYGTALPGAPARPALGRGRRRVAESSFGRRRRREERLREQTLREQALRAVGGTAGGSDTGKRPAPALG